MKRIFILLSIILILVILAIFLVPILFFAPTKSQVDKGVSVNSVKDVQVVASNLDIPWELVFLPSGEMLVTQRPGNLLKISKEKKVIKIDGVQHMGEGGLLGLALHPDFEKNNFIYIYLTTKTDSGLTNRVERYKLLEDTLTDKKVIIDNIPGASYHDGGRIVFGQDGLLYITTGDAGNSANSQNKASLAGKILRLKDDGEIPFDNPFGNAVYSYGHRNVQGITWDSNGNLWATEHFGRLRTVVLSPDGYLYVLTNNRDGRGTPKQGDNKIIKINPGALI